jgi:hypothetical protein
MIKGYVVWKTESRRRRANKKYSHGNRCQGKNGANWLIFDFLSQEITPIPLNMKPFLGIHREEMLPSFFYFQMKEAKG